MADDISNNSMSFAADYLGRLAGVIESLNTLEINNAVALIETAWQEDRQVITLGNGGSALIALHYICDWNKSISLKRSKPLSGRCLADNIGLFSAYSNDMSYDEVFVEQLKTVLCEGDLVIGISGSGDSENVIRAMDYANGKGAVTLGLSGYSGGRLRGSAQHSVWVPVDDMQLSEDVFLAFGHIVMQQLCHI